MDDPYLNIIHGHVWSSGLQTWVLHARYLEDNKKDAKKKVVVKETPAAAASKRPKKKRGLR